MAVPVPFFYLGHRDLPIDLAQGGELVEPFVVCYLDILTETKKFL
jgi:hypothetical protein